MRISFLLAIIIAQTSFGQTNYQRLVTYYNQQKNFNGTVLVAIN